MKFKVLKIIGSALTLLVSASVVAYCGGAAYAYFAYGQTIEEAQNAPRWVYDLYPYVLMKEEQNERQK